ncbi:hypothetical protein KIPB_000031 [Kipferlia bialata]|uniref:Uncharacterized protein n=1 Tax=Kipferlia bialata TaxID=797122 RepID=A0A9K3CND0_9EUKA|nr:hypothetical protein KIPB_000031 [Kipferlia bialata]|eukprot:g31.t1
MATEVLSPVSKTEVSHDTVKSEKAGPKRLISMDFIRGCAILFMLFVHSAGGGADTEYYLNPMDTLYKKLTVLLFLPAVIFGGWRGIFVQVSGAVFGYVQVSRAFKMLRKGRRHYRAFCVALLTRYLAAMVFMFVLAGVQQWLRGLWYQCIPNDQMFWKFRWYQMGQVESNPLPFFALAFPLVVVFLILFVPVVSYVCERLSPETAPAHHSHTPRRSRLLALAAVFYVLSLMFPLLTEPVRRWVERVKDWTRYQYATDKFTNIDSSFGDWYSLQWPQILSGWFMGVFPFFGAMLQGVSIGAMLRYACDTKEGVEGEGEGEGEGPKVESPHSARVYRLLWLSAIPYALMGVITTAVYGLDALITSPDTKVDPACQFMAVPQYYILCSLETLGVTFMLGVFERVDRETAARRAAKTLWVRRFSTVSLTVFALEFCVEGPVTYMLRFWDEDIVGWMNSRNTYAILARCFLTLLSWYLVTLAFDATECKFTPDWCLTAMARVLGGQKTWDPLHWQHTRAVPVACLEVRPKTEAEREGEREDVHEAVAVDVSESVKEGGTSGGAAVESPDGLAIAQHLSIEGPTLGTTI